MPSKRGSNGQFVTGRGDVSISLPNLIGLYKILIIAVLIFPWYAILINRNVSSTLFQYIIGKNFTDNCPKCQECPDPKCPKCPK